MSLEEQITELTAAIRDLIDTMGNAGVGEEEENPAPAKRGRKPPAKKAAPAKKPPRRKKKAGPTLDDVRDVLRKVSVEVSKEVAKEIMGEFDDAKKVTEVDESDYPELIAACEEALAEAGGEEDEDEDL